MFVVWKFWTSGTKTLILEDSSWRFFCSLALCCNLAYNCLLWFMNSLFPPVSVPSSFHVASPLNILGGNERSKAEFILPLCLSLNNPLWMSSVLISKNTLLNTHKYWTWSIPNTHPHTSTHKTTHFAPVIPTPGETKETVCDWCDCCAATVLRAAAASAAATTAIRGEGWKLKTASQKKQTTEINGTKEESERVPDVRPQATSWHSVTLVIWP